MHRCIFLSWLHWCFRSKSFVSHIRMTNLSVSDFSEWCNVWCSALQNLQRPLDRFHERFSWTTAMKGDYLWYLLLQANISLMLLSQAYIYFPSTARKCDGLLWPKKRVADSSNQLVTNLSFLLALLVTRQMPFLTLSLLNDDECTHPKLCLLNYRLWL